MSCWFGFSSIRNTWWEKNGPKEHLGFREIFFFFMAQLNSHSTAFVKSKEIQTKKKGADQTEMVLDVLRFISPVSLLKAEIKIWMVWNDRRPGPVFKLFVKLGFSFCFVFVFGFFLLNHRLPSSLLFILHPPPGPNELPSLQNDTYYRLTNERYLPVMWRDVCCKTR